MEKDLRCVIHTSYHINKHNECKRQDFCPDRKHLLCKLNQKIKYGGVRVTDKTKAPSLTKAKRDELRKIKIDPQKVIELSAAGKRPWEVTEAIYDMEFDHSDKKNTWLFYQKVRAIQKKHNCSLNTPIVEEKEVKKEA